MVLPLIAPIAGAVWVGKAIFGGDDMSLVNEMLPIYLAVQEGSPRPLHEASTLAGSHSKGQEKFAADADKLATLLSEAWEGDAAEGATKKVKKLAKAARETGTSLNTNAQNFDSQANSFGDLRGKMKHMDDPAPGGSGFLDRVNPFDTAAEKAVEKNQKAAQHNKALYDGYGSTTKSNAESITDKYGHAGSPGSGTQPGQPGYPGYPGHPGKQPPYPNGGDDAKRKAEEARRKAEEAARKQQEEARRKAEEQRRKMEEEARKREEEARRKAEEQRRKMEEEARKRQEEAKRKAEEQRRKMEEEARKRQEEARRQAEEQRRRMEEEARRRQQEAAQRAREAAEGMRRGGSFTPGGTSASSFSPSDFAGAGSGGGAGAGGAGAGAGAGGFGASGDASAAGAGRASGAMAPGGGAGAGAGAGAGRGGGGGRMGGMGGMMGGAGGGGGKGGEDKEHKRKVMATEDPNDLFGTDEKSVPPVIGDK